RLASRSLPRRPDTQAEGREGRHGVPHSYRMGRCLARGRGHGGESRSAWPGDSVSAAAAAPTVRRIVNTGIVTSTRTTARGQTLEQDIHEDHTTSDHHARLLPNVYAADRSAHQA